jgi:hypothetical protein
MISPILERKEVSKTHARFKILALSGFLLCSAIAAEAETIYVTSIERFNNRATEYVNGYYVEAHTTDTDPKIDYRLACGVNAVRLQTGRSYIVEPVYGRDARYLAFPDVKDDKGGLVCTIESEKISK